MPTSSLTCAAPYSVTQIDIDAGFVTNIASASAGNTVSSFMVAGDVVSYEYDVTNAGNVTVIDPITIADDKIDTVICPALPTNQDPMMIVTKQVSEPVQVGGPVYDVRYTLTMENTGNVTLTNLGLVDDLASILAPAVMVGDPVIEATGFDGQG